MILHFVKGEKTLRSGGEDVTESLGSVSDFGAQRWQHAA
jgi:hypothetical protein